MPDGAPDLPQVLPSAADAEFECVLADPAAARAPSTGGSPTAVCPPGYVPRRKQTTAYRLRGKEAVTEGPPQENPGGRDGAGS